MAQFLVEKSSLPLSKSKTFKFIMCFPAGMAFTIFRLNFFMALHMTDNPRTIRRDLFDISLQIIPLVRLI